MRILDNNVEKNIDIKELVDLNLQDKSVLVWIDDIRNPFTETWSTWIEHNCASCKNYFRIWLVNYYEFYDFLLLVKIPEFICFDHDLADKHIPEKTGYDCAKVLVEECMNLGLNIPNYAIQSDNGPGRLNIQSYLENYHRFYLSTIVDENNDEKRNY